MCGRYTLLAQAEELAAEFDLAEPVPVAPRYNIAPSQEVPIVRLAASAEMAVVRFSEASGKCRLDILRWGLIPHWAKDEKFGYKTINARSETVATQPSFRDAFRKRRCLVPASGFYEWQKSMQKGKEVKQPHYIRRKDGRPMGLAGLWERWVSPDGKEIESFTIITTDANEVMRPFHHRMPVILRPEDYDLWLSPEAKGEELQALLVPCPVEWLVVSPVSRQVNSPRNDDPSFIAELS